MRSDDTIVAIATPPGAGGLGIVRLSGSRSREIAGSLLRLQRQESWTSWSATLAEVLDEAGNLVDQAVVTWFAAPRSYTAQDVVEISCHGSPVVLRHVVERCLQAGARLAEPGEFTLRAYLNGRIDLPQAEAVHDLIEATTLHQARVAAQQMEGSLSRVLAPLKAQLVQWIALLEAGIDFAEDDLDVATSDVLEARLTSILIGIDRLRESYRFGKLVHDGLNIAIVGRPNVGKSSLFNALLQQDRAIVTAIAGTTRDTVSETFSLAGIPARLVDTAGLRESTDLVEQLGVERSRRAMADADLTIVVIDLSEPLGDEDQGLIETAGEQGLHILVGNKSDLAPTDASEFSGLRVSALTGDGVEALRARLVALIAPQGFSSPQAGLITSVRHERLLSETAEALVRARAAVGVGLPHELLLLDGYAALRPLDELTGATTADDILNHIFSTFCIGK